MRNIHPHKGGTPYLNHQKKGWNNCSDTTYVKALETSTHVGRNKPAAFQDLCALETSTHTRVERSSWFLLSLYTRNIRPHRGGTHLKYANRAPSWKQPPIHERNLNRTPSTIKDMEASTHTWVELIRLNPLVSCLRNIHPYRVELDDLSRLFLISRNIHPYRGGTYAFMHHTIFSEKYPPTQGWNSLMSCIALLQVETSTHVGAERSGLPQHQFAYRNIHPRRSGT